MTERSINLSRDMNTLLFVSTVDPSLPVIVVHNESY